MVGKDYGQLLHWHYDFTIWKLREVFDVIVGHRNLPKYEGVGIYKLKGLLFLLLDEFL